MQRTVDATRKAILYISALVLVAGYPATAMATSEEPVTSSELPVTTMQPEPEEPPLTYTYDPTTEKWNSEKWQYNPETGAYEQPPEPVIIEPETSSLTSPDSQGGGEIIEDTEESTEKTANTNVDIDNTVTSDAVSGDALISSNTAAGNALSGDATAVANIINSVNSSVAAGENQKITTFTKDIYGDVEGDIILYPMLLKAMLEQKAKNMGAAEINTTTDFDITNDVTLNAKSGDATVENNTTAGDATTGNATAMANVINILNSMIATQDSFIGTINIYGSLDGDILLAPDLIPQMLAHNGGSSSGSPTQLSAQDTTTIVNNISAVAESGAASVFGNTEAGDATTGDASSNVVIFNVTGREIVAENSMLIFVNVLGKWVGMILDAPQGATAAMIGTGVTTNREYAPDLTLKSESRHGITNTIAVNATSGDATVSNNTSAGNATSGNAHALANVANISNSSVNLSGWFRILTFNIFEDWTGSVKIGPPYGMTPEEAAPTLQPTGPVQFVPKESKPVQNVSTNAPPVVIDSRFVSTDTSDESTETKVEETSTVKSEPKTDVMGVMDENDANEEVGDNNLLFIIAGSIVLIGGLVAGVRWIRA